MEKEAVLLEISSTANSSYEQLKDLQLQMQSLIFQDATPERLNNIKKIVDEIESHTLKFQKMNVELNYVHNSYVEGMMPANVTPKEHEIIAALPRYKRYQKKLTVFCGDIETSLMQCDLYKRRSALRSLVPSASGGPASNKPFDLSTLLGGGGGGRDKYPQLATSVIAQSATSTTVIVKVDDCMNCLLRFEAGELMRVLIKGPTESFSGGGSGDPSTAFGPEASVDVRNKIDYFSPSSLRLFRELTTEAIAVLSHLRRGDVGDGIATSGSSSTAQQVHQRFMDWLKSFCGLHAQQCVVCGRILSKNHLPPIRRDLSDYSRVMHDHC